MDFALISSGMSVLAVIVSLGTVIFGSGRGLSDRFSSLQNSISDSIDKLRQDIELKQDKTESTLISTINNLNDKLHMVEKANLEFRSTVAETYMRRESFYKATEKMERDVTVAFEKVERRLDRMEVKFDAARKEDKEIKS